MKEQERCPSSSDMMTGAWVSFHGQVYFKGFPWWGKRPEPESWPYVMIKEAIMGLGQVDGSHATATMQNQNS